MDARGPSTKLIHYPRVDPTPCGCRALGSPNPMLYAYRLLFPVRPSAMPQLWEWQQPASVNQQAVRGSYDVVCTRAVQSLSPLCEGRPSMTRNEITQEIQKLTEEIRTLSY